MIIAGLILLPIAGAIACSLSRGRLHQGIGVLVALATLALALVAFVELGGAGVAPTDAGGWRPPLGIHLRVNGAAAVLLLTFAAVGPLAASGFLFASPTAPRSALPCFLFTWAAFNALVLSSDIFNLYVTLELLTLSAVGLVATAGGERGAGAAAMALRYLLFALPGSLAYLLGVTLLYSASSTLDLDLLRASQASLKPEIVTSAALALIAGGLALKAALFPLHAWLPAIYTSAGATASALLSALVGKAPFLVLLVVWTAVSPSGVGRVDALLAALGAAGAVWGALLAREARSLREVVAYSSVSQSAYLFLFFALKTPDSATAVIVLAVSHALAAAALFLAADALAAARGSDALEDLRGAAQQMPIPFFAIGLAGVSLMGMPPSGGFVGKWLLVREAVAQEAWWIVVIIIGGGLLAAGYVVRVVRLAFTVVDPPLPVSGRKRHVERVALVLALLAVMLGAAPRWLIDRAATGIGG